MAKITVEQHNEKAVFVGVIKQGDDERQIMEYLDELEFLAETAGAIGLREVISGEINNCTFENTTSKE